MPADTNTAETTTAKRGRKPGAKVQSLDLRAYRALARVPFETFFEQAAADEDGTGEWRDQLVDKIIATLRTQNIF